MGSLSTKCDNAHVITVTLALRFGHEALKICDQHVIVKASFATQMGNMLIFLHMKSSNSCSFSMPIRHEQRSNSLHLAVEVETMA